MRCFPLRGALLAASILAISLSPSVFADEAFQFEASYSGEYWENVKGGIKRGGAFIDNIDATLEVDAERAFGLSGGTAFAYVLYNNSSTLSEPIVGDTQTVSNIDNSHVLRLYELWYEQAFGAGQSLKFGLYDLNSEFDAIEPAGLFINSSHGISPEYSQSGVNGPSIFPSTSLALRYFNQLNDVVSVQAAILDAVPNDPNDPQRNRIRLSGDEGSLIALESNFESDGRRYGLGTWFYSEKSATLNGTGMENNRGIYGIYRNQLMSAAADGKDLAFWLVYGVAKESVNQIAAYLGAGVVVSQLIPGRPDDTVGFAVAHARNGNTYRDSIATTGARPESAETNFELTYRATINDRIVIQPDIQYIRNPGTDPALDDALVIGIRVEVRLL